LRAGYPYRFASQNATTVRRALPCGDYGLDLNGQLVGQTFSPPGGGISRKADKWLPLLTNRTPVVAAALQNTAGIVGAAVAAQVDPARNQPAQGGLSAHCRYNGPRRPQTG
jgi:hypothetical protein